MNTTPAPAAALVDRPVFVVGERPAAMQLVHALGETPGLCAMPLNRLLPDLALAVERCAADLDPLTARRRLSAFLMRRGYNYDTVAAVVRRLLISPGADAIEE